MISAPTNYSTTGNRASDEATTQHYDRDTANLNDNDREPPRDSYYWSQGLRKPLLSSVVPSVVKDINPLSRFVIHCYFLVTYFFGQV